MHCSLLDFESSVTMKKINYLVGKKESPLQDLFRSATRKTEKANQRLNSCSLEGLTFLFMSDR